MTFGIFRKQLMDALNRMHCLMFVKKFLKKVKNIPMKSHAMILLPLYFLRFAAFKDVLMIALAI